MIVSLWNLTGFSAALLPRCQSNFRAIEKVQSRISRLRDFTRSCGKTSYRLWIEVQGYMPGPSYDHQIRCGSPVNLVDPHSVWCVNSTTGSAGANAGWNVGTKQRDSHFNGVETRLVRWVIFYVYKEICIIEGGSMACIEANVNSLLHRFVLM